MAERKVFHVTPAAGPERGWEVRERQADRPASRHDRKEEAVEKARELAQAGELGQVVIHKQDGTIQKEYTYGEDPYPPEG